MKKLDEVLEQAKNGGKKRVVVAAAADAHVLEAIKNSVVNEISIPILVGDKDKIEKISKEISFNLSDVEIIDEKNAKKAASKAVEVVASGKADVLMKGLVGTADLMRAVLNKETGIRTNAMIVGIGVLEVPAYHKLLGITDYAMNVDPDIRTKVSMINTSVNVFRKLGTQTPKVAILGAVEVVNPKMPATVDAAILSTMNRRKQIKNCIVDGPFAMDNAISKEACHHKGIDTEVGGDPDILVMPDINSANMVYKSLNFLAGANMAGVILGAKVPIVLVSRADNAKSKMYSIALASVLA